MIPLHISLTREQIDWLDSQKGGAIVSRSEAVRHVIQSAMAPRRGRRPAATQPTTEPSTAQT